MFMGSSTVPLRPRHEVAHPRVALMHDWVNVQTEGWIRIALDELQIPYDYISVHEARDNPRLGNKYDVILFGPVRGNQRSLVSIAALDNLLKGGAGQAVQSMNICLGLDDRAGFLGEPSVTLGKLYCAGD